MLFNALAVDTIFQSIFFLKNVDASFYFSLRKCFFSHNSKHHGKFLKRSKVVSHILEKVLKHNEDDDNNTGFQSQERSFIQESAEIVLQPENGNSLEVQVEEVSTHAPFVPSLQASKQATFLDSICAPLSGLAQVTKDL